MGLHLLLALFLCACVDDTSGPIPPPEMQPPPEPVIEPTPAPEPQVEQARPVRAPAWGDGTTELRRTVERGEGGATDYLVGVSWVGPDPDGMLIHHSIMFQPGQLVAAGPDAQDENLDGIDAYGDLIPAWQDGTAVGPHAKLTPFVRCQVEDERTRCRPCDALADDPSQAQICWPDQPSFTDGIWQAIGDRIGMTADQVRAVPHQEAISAPFQRGDFSVGVCKLGGAEVTEYQVARNDRVLKDTKVIAFSHIAIDRSDRVLRQVVVKPQVGFPHTGGMLVQTTGVLPLMKGESQIPGPYAVGTWCDAMDAWCTSVADGCSYSVETLRYPGREEAVPAEEAAPAD